MKDNKCPYCSAPIQENASFCLYCMKSLDSKTVIKKQKSKKRLAVLVCLILAIILIFIAWLLFKLPSKSQPQSNGYQSSVHETGSQPTESSITSESSTYEVVSGRVSQPKLSSSSKAVSVVSKDQSSVISLPGHTVSKENTSSSYHNHSYTAKIITAPTCAKAGEKEYTCSCGHTYTEKIPATGEHDWVALTKTVHHDEVGHYEDTQKSRPVTKYQCPICYSKFDTLDSYYNHFDNTHKPSYTGDPITIFREQYSVKNEYEYYNETKWVVDKAAYDEKVITGYQCSVCKAKK